jgi:hypothetical protein
MDYISFADESYSKRYKSIATFSFKADFLETVNSYIEKILRESNVEKEFKWERLKNAKYRYCAEKMINSVWDFVNIADARIDVIIWDTHDSRHRVRNPDEMENYGRMFFHLHSKSLQRRPKMSKWQIFLDEGVKIDWNIVGQCLSAVGKQRDFVDLSLFKGFFTNPHYTISKSDLIEIKSHEQPCCQIADLFAGLSVFSRTNYDNYEKWLNYTTDTLPLFPQEKPKITNAEENRFPILKNFNAGCKQRKLGVSLKTKRSLDTPNPNNPINFWPYIPQHDEDKAPTKNK